MHDHLGQPLFAAEEVVADPQQVFFALLVQRHPRAHPGVDAEVVAAVGHQLQALEEGAVVVGQGLVQLAAGPQPVGLVAAPHRRRHAVGQQGLAGPELRPHWPEVGVVQELQQGRLVVPFQRRHLPEVALGLGGQDQVDHPARIRAPVHIVAEEDQLAAGVGFVARGVEGDLAQQPQQQVDPPMHVADHVKDHTFGRQGDGRLGGAGHKALEE